MQIDIVTIFPALVDAALSEGVIGRARARGVVDIRVRDLRAYTDDRHRTVDDVPFGGGPGMVMKAEPFFRGRRGGGGRAGTAGGGRPDDTAGAAFHAGGRGAFERDRRGSCCCAAATRVSTSGLPRPWSPTSCRSATTCSPAGNCRHSSCWMRWSGSCRVWSATPDRSKRDSFTRGLLDHPHYTRPASFRGMDVPAVLPSGHHGGDRAVAPPGAYPANAGTAAGCDRPRGARRRRAP